MIRHPHCAHTRSQPHPTSARKTTDRTYCKSSNSAQRSLRYALPLSSHRVKLSRPTRLRLPSVPSPPYPIVLSSVPLPCRSLAAPLPLPCRSLASLRQQAQAVAGSIPGHLPSVTSPLCPFPPSLPRSSRTLRDSAAVISDGGATLNSHPHQLPSPAAPISHPHQPPSSAAPISLHQWCCCLSRHSAAHCSTHDA